MNQKETDRKLALGLALHLADCDEKLGHYRIRPIKNSLLWGVLVCGMVTAGLGLITIIGKAG
jgi:hypothetical protein